MTENKRYVYIEHKNADYILEDPNYELDFIEMLGDCLEPQEIVNKLNELYDENKRLKQQIEEIKTDEKQLSISFMDYKMQLIEVLQQNYNYAYNQRQKNLDNPLVAKAYEVLAYTLFIIAETMNVDIERFPKGDVE